MAYNQFYLSNASQNVLDSICEIKVKRPWKVDVVLTLSFWLPMIALDG